MMLLNDDVDDDDRNPILEPRSTDLHREQEIYYPSSSASNISIHSRRAEATGHRRQHTMSRIMRAMILRLSVVLCLSMLSIIHFQTSWTSNLSDKNEDDVQQQVAIEHSKDCLSSSGDSDEITNLIQSTNQVIIVMPAKAAGTSLKQFTYSCNDEKMVDNVLNYPDKLENLLTHTYEMPGVIASHMYQSKALINVIQNVPKDTLLVYSHRQETSRVLSGVKQVVTKGCDGKRDRGAKFMFKSEGACHITESNLINLIKQRPHEIGTSGTRLLTCETFNAIENYAPNLVFMDYKQASQLQERVAKKYCPNVRQVEDNVGTSKKQSYVSIPSLNGANSTVTLDDWLETKSSMLEFSLQLNRDASCVAKTRELENKLFSSCKDGFVKVKYAG